MTMLLLKFWKHYIVILTTISRQKLPYIFYRKRQNEHEKQHPPIKKQQRKAVRLLPVVDDCQCIFLLRNSKGREEVESMNEPIEERELCRFVRE